MINQKRGQENTTQAGQPDGVDEYQKRYLLHQQFGKKHELIALMKERHSNRRYSDQAITDEVIEELIDCTKFCPSSCDRHGVRIRVVTDRDQKALLDGLLVGGTGWIYRVPVIFLLFADPLAYKAGDPPGSELNYNAYLDAGVMLQQLSLMATSLGLHSAFVNPQIREMNREHFANVFSDRLFCGAFAFGWPHSDPIEKHRNTDVNMKF